MESMISYERALELISKLDIDMLGSEEVAFNQSHGRILAQDIVAPYDMPQFPMAAMDGYVFGDMASNELEIVGEMRAGEDKDIILDDNQCIRIYTGALLPKMSSGAYANRLLIVEDSIIHDNKLCIKAEMPQPNMYIRQIAENYHKGDILAHKGDKIDSFMIGLFADINLELVHVSKKAKVGVIITGDELIEVGESKNSKDKVRCVNNHILESLISNIGAIAKIYQKSGDDKNQIQKSFLDAIKECDMVILSGGMSMGKYDFSQNVIEENCEVIFKKIRLKPGKPVMMARSKEYNNIVFGLPGFPNSCATTFLLFVRRVIYALLGRRYEDVVLKGTLLNDIKRVDTRKEFRVCDIVIKDGILYADTSKKGALQSSMINNFVGNVAFILLDENGGDLPKGSKIDIILFKENI